MGGWANQHTPPTHQHTNTHQHHKHTPTHQHANTPTHQHTNTPTHQHTNTPTTHKHTNTPTHKHEHEPTDDARRMYVRRHHASTHGSIFLPSFVHSPVRSFLPAVLHAVLPPFVQRDSTCFDDHLLLKLAVNLVESFSLLLAYSASSASCW